MFCAISKYPQTTPIQVNPLRSRLAQRNKTCHHGLNQFIDRLKEFFRDIPIYQTTKPETIRNMQTRWILIDGYSLIHRQGTPGERPGNLMAARRRLIRNLEEIAGSLAERITVVFDGAGSPNSKGEGYESAAIEVLFSPSDKTADTLIERMVQEAPDSTGIMVVTSDRLERETTGAAGADTMSCGNFLEWCKRTRRELSRQAGGHGNKFGSWLGDYFPKG
jgi:uncharacterized protein